MLICSKCERLYPIGSSERCPYDDSLLYMLGNEGPTRKPWGPNDIVAQKYQIIEELPKRNGAGISFKCQQMKLQRIVELRILPAGGLEKPGDQARFQREVQVWSTLKSPYLARLFDFGYSEREEPFLVLEYHQAGTLGDYIKEHGVLSISDALKLADSLLQGISTAHQANVLHRNINPESIVVNQQSNGNLLYKLTGFGLAKSIVDNDDPTQVTMTGMVIGDPSYMAPECIMMGTLDHKTDMYSFGVTLYQALTGHKPFAGNNLSELLRAHVQGTPTPIDHYRKIPLSLKQWINHLISKNPDDRYPNAEIARQILLQLTEDLDFIEESVDQTPISQIEQEALQNAKKSWWKNILSRFKNQSN
jgi:serine/threonine protein kinase